jgi:hypothetical protein
MKKITITHDMKNTDGSAWTAAQFAGFEISIDGKPAVALPAQFSAGGVFEFDAVALGITLPEGQHSATARAVDKDGDRSDPTPAVVWVEKVIPTVPKTLAVS